MRFAVHHKNGLRTKSVLAGFAVLAIVGGVFSASFAYATADTSVQVVVNSGNVVPALAVNGGGSTVTTEAMPLKLQGTLTAVSQIQVYVDGIFSVTIPIAIGETSFSYDLVIPGGSHTIKLVGITPFANISPSDSLTVVYQPPTQTPASNPSGSGSVITTTGGGAVITSTPSSSSVSLQAQASSGLPGWLYNSLLTLDLVRPGQTKAATADIQRFSFISFGLLFTVFSRPVLASYRWIRYRWLGWRKHPLPDGLRRHPIGYIRATGLSLIAFVFLLL